jgi:hypothetical protein
MKAKHVVTIVLVLGLVAAFGLSTPSFAGWGRGGYGGYCDGPRSGNCPRWDNSGQGGYAGNLTDEEIATLQKERSAFFEQTRELRDKLYQKELELRSELAKQTPDAKKAAELQKEISALEGELDQQTLDHRLKMRKENPNLYGKGFGRGMGPGYGRGQGYGQGPGYGRGPGRGSCCQ